MCFIYYIITLICSKRGKFSMTQHKKNNISSDAINSLKELGELALNEPMKKYTTFRTGGPADIYIRPNNINDLQKIVKIAKEISLPKTIIGGGSNLLISDRGIRGLVIHMCSKPNNKISLTKNEDIVYADAGITKENFINYSIENSYEGIEFMAGIPGCIGGGIYMNAGTNLGSFVDIIKKVELIDNSGEKIVIEASEDMFSYRKFNIPEEAIITAGLFQLKKSKNINNTRNIIKDLLEERSLKHPLSFPSAGSVFKNPDGHSSWKLVDESGLKGFQIGGAKISELHTNFIINYDEATSQDIKSLIEHIQDKIYSIHGISLQTEIKMIGEF